MLSYHISTPIQASISHVKELFTEDLLLKLSPPFPPVSLQRFDGCKKGDQVILKINFVFTQLTWSSLITSDVLTKEEWYFIDEGVEMPFGLKYWQHKHRVKKIDHQSAAIIDEISFDTGKWFLNYLLFPFLWGMIFYRKPFYKKYLNFVKPNEINLNQ
jgi:ligand-binding SRPBCC domain-containing protein